MCIQHNGMDATDRGLYPLSIHDIIDIPLYPLLPKHFQAFLRSIVFVSDRYSDLRRHVSGFRQGTVHNVYGLISKL